MSEPKQSSTTTGGRPAQCLVAILVAAGNGCRLGGDTPKQFQDLNGRPLLTHSLATLLLSGLIDRSVVVVPEKWVSFTQDLLRDQNLTVDAVVAGGSTRRESVHHGLHYIERQSWQATHVLVHDAARPFVSTALIRAVVAAVHETGAATLALPVSDTLMRAVEEKDAPKGRQQAEELVDRSGMWAVQTPQVFDLPLLRQAHAHASVTVDAPDDGSLVLALGRRLNFVPSAWWNFKLTSPEDFDKARLIATTRNKLRSAPFQDVPTPKASHGEGK